MIVDHDLLVSKASNAQAHLDRITAKVDVDLPTFMADIDRQDIVSFNLHLVIENCIDIAAHIISENGWGVPGSAAEMFYLLEEKGLLSVELTEKMIKAVGLRNLIVHEYNKIDLKRLFDTVHNDLQGINSFLATLFEKLGIT